MENDSQITACDAKVLRYFRKHGPAPTADAKKALADVSVVPYRSIVCNCLTNNTVNTDVNKAVTIESAIWTARITHTSQSSSFSTSQSENRRIFPPPPRSHLRDKLSINRQLSIVNTKFGICRIIGTLHNSHIV